MLFCFEPGSHLQVNAEKILVTTSAAAVNRKLLLPSLFDSFVFSGGTAEKSTPDGLKGDYINF